VIVEVKSVEALAPVHEAQLLTYRRLSERRLGFVINFSVALFRSLVRVQPAEPVPLESG
jgi:GxxExxY protein